MRGACYIHGPRRSVCLNAFSQCIFQVEAVDAGLVGIDYVAVVGHSFGDPVVSAEGLHPPDLIYIRKGYAVHFIGAVLFKEGRSAQHALACA